MQRANTYVLLGEKRKRKLQYLQKLLKEESTNEQYRGSVSPQPSESYLSSTSVDYEYSDFAPSPSMEPPDTEPLSIYPNAIDLPAGSSASTLESQCIPYTTQPYHGYNWQPPLYNSASDLDISTWNTLTWAYNTPYQIPHGTPQTHPFTYPPQNPLIPTDLPTLPSPPAPTQSLQPYPPPTPFYFPLAAFDPSTHHQNQPRFPPYVSPPFPVSYYATTQPSSSAP